MVHASDVNVEPKGYLKLMRFPQGGCKKLHILRSSGLGDANEASAYTLRDGGPRKWDLVL
jgi:hypothetical protein